MESFSKKLLIVAHAPSANTLKLREAVARGAGHEDIENVDVRVLAPLDAGPDDVLACDAIILGTTENLGYMSGALKDFFDRSYYPIPLFPGVTQLDFTGPAQMFAQVPDATICVVAASKTPIQTDSGFSVVPGYEFANCPSADMICIPGGPGVFEAINDETLVDFVARQCEGAQYLTSVCTGAFILGAAGYLEGRHATTHWGYTDALENCGATLAAGRIVVDGNLITAGGVTSGIEFSLAVIARIWGETLAKSIQLRMEYNPAPPFPGGHPSSAEPEILKGVQPFYDRALAKVLAALSERNR